MPRSTLLIKPVFCEPFRRGEPSLDRHCPNIILWVALTKVWLVYDVINVAEYNGSQWRSLVERMVQKLKELFFWVSWSSGKVSMMSAYHWRPSLCSLWHESQIANQTLHGYLSQKKLVENIAVTLPTNVHLRLTVTYKYEGRQISRYITYYKKVIIFKSEKHNSYYLLRKAPIFHMFSIIMYLWNKKKQA